MSVSAKIQPCLWFAGNAEEAVKFYTSIFPDSTINHIDHYTEAGKEHHQMPVSSVMVVEFTLNGQKFMALNGPDIFKFSEAVSFTINCEDQAEVDKYWEALTADGGKPVECGWCRDKYGLSWQVTPTIIDELMKKGTEKQRAAVMNAMMQMKKLEVAKFQKAFDDAA